MRGELTKRCGEEELKNMLTERAMNKLRPVSKFRVQLTNLFAAASRSQYSPAANSSPLLNSIFYALKSHWPEYLMEAFGLGLFMISACTFGVLLEHPNSPVRQAISDATLRRVLMGAAMGFTNIANIYSPWGKRSGAHLNPSTTWTFFRLGKVEPWDAVFYSLSQFIGGIAGVLMARAVLMSLLAHPAVNYVATTPGPSGTVVASAAEVSISFILMSVVLRVSNSARFARYTGVFASALVMLYISLEAPLSGMSMNPARTFGSALTANTWTALWVYFIAPPLGMLLAAETYVRMRGVKRVFCAKYHHHNDKRCIFRCNFQELRL
jgi:aquaporin Z